MSEAMKGNSSLELYETAYKLQYVDGNIPEACRIYKALIDEFPNSNECGYAVIQLQKILANDVADRIKTGNKTKLQSFVLTICALSFLIVTLIAFLSLKKVNSEIEALCLVSQALSIMYGGNENEALELLNKAKVLSRGTMIDPYLLSATIFMNMQQYSRARGELESYEKISGKTDSIFKKMVAMRNEKERVERAPAAKIDSQPQSPQPSAMPLSEANPPAATFKPEKIITQQPAVKPKPRSEKPRSGPSRPIRKGSSTANQDSVSFF